MDQSSTADGVRYAVLKAMYDITVENERPGVGIQPSRAELVERTGIDETQVAFALKYLTCDGLAQDEEMGPTYSITQRGRDEVKAAIDAESGESISPPGEHQPLVMDMRLVISLLDYIASKARLGQSLGQPQAEGFSDEVVAYHLLIMQEAGLIRGKRSLSGKWGLYPLTWEGQKLLEATKDDTAFNRAVKQVGGVATTVTVGVFQAFVNKMLLGQ